MWRSPANQRRAAGAEVDDAVGVDGLDAMGGDADGLEVEGEGEVEHAATIRASMRTTPQRMFSIDATPSRPVYMTSTFDEVARGATGDRPPYFGRTE
jgi:hypothetical protein